jgi:hypothetical protein
MLAKRRIVERLRDDLAALPNPDDETLARVKSLKKLYHRSGDFDRKDCYYSSDAILVLEAPTDSNILTSNKRHIEPIATSLGKPVVSY